MPARDIAVALGEIRRSGSWWRCRCPVHESSGPTLALKDGERGIVVVCHAGCSTGDIFRELRRLDLLEPQPGSASPQENGDRGERVEEERDRARRIAIGAEIWRSSYPSSGTIAERYWRSRRIGLRLPTTIRISPSLRHTESGERRPAMVCLVQHVDYGIVGAHCTYLAIDGSAKATIAPNKKCFGSVGGGAVRLGPILPEQWLVVGEGIESTASAMDLWGIRSGWAALSATGVRNLVLPREAQQVVIACDNDANGVGQAAARDSAWRWQAEGRNVKFALPPVPGADFNDILRMVSRVSAHPDFEDPINLWPPPDLTVLRQGRRAPPEFPIELFEGFWRDWITLAAAGASAPVDYTGCSLLACSATLIGHARWVSPWKGWNEPPVLWIGNVGDPSSGKSPAADPPLKIIREIEISLAKSFPDLHRQWLAEKASASAHKANWESDVKDAVKKKRVTPEIPAAAIEPPEPVRARLVSSDATVEKLAELAAAHPKGLMVIRDELSGWYGSLGRYSKSGADRSFWVESYGGRGFTIDRKNAGVPIIIDRLGIGLFGGIQPDRLCEMMESPDDCLVARFLWAWPNKVTARRPHQEADITRAAEALRLLYELPLVPDENGGFRPLVCRMTDDAADLFEQWWTQHQAVELAGPLAGTIGKAAGHVIRLSLVLEHLWWCGGSGLTMPPSAISAKAVTAAIAFVADYFHPMAARVFGDAGLPEADRLATVVARWIMQTRPTVINAKLLRRTAGLPGLREAEKVKSALAVLVEADWIAPAPARAGGGAGRA